MSSDAKAAEYMAQGEKTLKKTSFFSFGGGSQKFEDASDLFEKAGNQFKISRKCAQLLLVDAWAVERSRECCTCKGGGGSYCVARRRTNAWRCGVCCMRL